VLWRAAAGPRIGYGHLVRSVRLAHALGVSPCVSIRGGAAAVAAARRLGAHVVTGPRSTALARAGLRALVIDDPTPRQAAPWFSMARRRGVLTVGLHDLGLGCLEGDIVVDGSVGGPWNTHRVAGACLGPSYAIVDPEAARSRWRPSPSRPRPRLLVALGGGARRGTLVRLASELRRVVPEADVRVAGGFGRLESKPTPGVAWLGPLPTLTLELSSADVAIVAGGVTAYEACAVGVPTVAVAVVEAQRPTVVALAGRGAVIDAGRLHPRAGAAATIDRIARLVRGLVRSPGRAAGLSSAARAVTDGRGASRVARLVRRRLAGAGPRGAPR
jgi:spore coat polysaccharide biosynthesis predicted glycosyltransferase SpsG